MHSYNTPHASNSASQESLKPIPAALLDLIFDVFPNKVLGLSGLAVSFFSNAPFLPVMLVQILLGSPFCFLERATFAGQILSVIKLKLTFARGFKIRDRPRVALASAKRISHLT